MFVGHFAVALAAKRASPRLSLPLLFTAVQFADILWPIFILVGVEHSRIVPGLMPASVLDLYDFPYSHSLVMSLVWSLAWGAWFFAKGRVRDGLIVAGCVFSHFLLDVATHRPDMQLAPGSDVRWGLGLWNSVPLTVIVESLLFAGGLYVYVRGTRATGRMGTIGLAALAVVLVGTWLSGMFGPPPPGIQVVAVSILVMIPIILLWAWRIDRARVSNTK
ncbi:MAG TPA: hypothetical protein VGK73_12725 [Polyangiaceae bacterium]